VLSRVCHLRSEKGALVISDEGEDNRFEEELSSDVLAMLAVFLLRLYGSCTQQCWEPIDGVRTALTAARCS
jgi:predicted site-specific integrase-resolvase